MNNFLLEILVELFEKQLMLFLRGEIFHPVPFEMELPQKCQPSLRGQAPWCKFDRFLGQPELCLRILVIKRGEKVPKLLKGRVGFSLPMVLKQKLVSFVQPWLEILEE